MAVERPDLRVRYRALEVAGGSRAEVWLERGHNVVHRKIRPNGQGTSNWVRCTQPECLGEAIVTAGPCFVHADDRQRDAYHANKLARGHSLSLRGAEITPDHWELLMTFLGTCGGLTKYSFSFAGAEFTFKPRITDVSFSGHVSFDSAILAEGLEIARCHFRRGLGLSFVDFRRGPGYFKGCEIDSYFNVSYAHTDQHIAFDSCSFSEGVHADGVTRDFRLDNCEVTGPCELRKAKLANLSLVGARLRGEINVAELESEHVRAQGLIATEARKIGPFWVNSTLDLSRSQFRQRAQIIADAGVLRLFGASFAAGGRIEVERANVELSSVITGGPLAVVGKGSAMVSSVVDADAGDLILSHIDLTRCFFYGAHGLETLTLEPTVRLPSAPPPLRAKRRCIADEFAWRSLRNTLRKDDWSIMATPSNSLRKRRAGTDEPRQLTAAQVASVYRALRKSLESRSNKPGAADFYYGEMEMRRRDRSTPFAERAIIWVYWLGAGYGLRASRALVSLLAVLAIGALLMLTIGLARSNAGLVDGLLASAESLIPGIGVGERLTDAGRAIDIVATIAGPALLGLAAFALRNRVMR